MDNYLQVIFFLKKPGQKSKARNYFVVYDHGYTSYYSTVDVLNFLCWCYLECIPSCVIVEYCIRETTSGAFILNSQRHAWVTGCTYRHHLQVFALEGFEQIGDSSL